MLTICLIIFIGINQVHVASATTLLDSEPIPQLCDSVQCPSDAEMHCPEDSSIRDLRVMNAVDLIISNTLGNNGINNISSLIVTTESSNYNSSLVDEVLYAQCCLSKKCVCKTCYIPDCKSDGDKVMIELEPEAMDTPGQCCGKYECQQEPNCSEFRDTDYYWLQNCQRCTCKSGRRICEQKCDEKSTAICESKNQEMYNDGERWDEDCRQCECVRGEVNCWISFCGPLNCPSDRQVQLKDGCCPVCWPKGHPMPGEEASNYDEGYGYERDPKKHQDTDDNTVIIINNNTTERSKKIVEEHPKEDLGTDDNTEQPLVPLATVIVTATSTTIENSSKESTTAPPPCQIHDFPNVVEVVQPINGFKDPNVYHVIIVILTIIIGGLYFYIRHLHAKQRSYRPVSNFDDKV